MKHRTHNRILSFFLALVMLCTNAPFPVNSVETEKGSAPEQPANTTLVYDYDTLKITKDGTQISSLSLQSHEKIEISADGISANAEYQWQVQHPENDDVWVNIYDGTNQTISVTAALVGNVLREDGTAKLRCRAYTDDYAYLTNTLTVTLCSEVQSVGTVTGENKTLLAAAGGDTNAETPEFVTVTINYNLYVNKKNSDDQFEEVYVGSAFDSYVASLRYNDPLITSVHCPTIVGYAPVLTSITVGGVEKGVTDKDFDSDNNEVEISLASITSDVVYTVEYRPANVKYEVLYYFQNIYDDLYVEDATIKGTVVAEGKTGTNPDLAHVGEEIDGFTSLYYEPETIAADGSTVFHVYYERNYYLMEFDCNQGYGTDTLYVRYGTYISVPDPVRAGYVFAGWDLVATDDPANSEELGNEILNEHNEPTGFYTGDGHENVLPATMPPYNSAYKALWTKAKTYYTMAYWIVNSDGSKTYIGSRTVNSKEENGSLVPIKSGDQVDGVHDLASEADGGPAICGYEEHSHEADGCYTCGQEVHTHTKDDCFQDMNLETNQPGDNGIAAIRGYENGGEPQTGYIYVIINGTNLWPKLYLNGEYYTINSIGAGNTAATQDQIDTIVDGGQLGDPVEGNYGNETLSVVKYKAKTTCDEEQHTHDNSCRDCMEHTHLDSCYQDKRHLVEVHTLTYTDDKGNEVEIKTDVNKTVLGDGSTVVNVYYEYKEYTLKFYYAATTGGTADDEDNDASTYDTIKIVGGTTYYFGRSGTNSAIDETLLENEYWNHSGEWGSISALPTLNEEGKKRNYEKGSVTYEHNNTNVTYHYISFKARYGDDISGMWPCAVFNSADRKDKDNTNGWSGTKAFVSAWNGEHHVKYSEKGNQTIKGVYEKLDDWLLFDPAYLSGLSDSDKNDLEKNGTEVSFLCFWENGANIGWSVPELYRYKIWLEGNAPNGETTVTKDNVIVGYEEDGTPIIRDGVTFYLADSYDTCDNSTVGEQTQVGLTGYSPCYLDDITKGNFNKVANLSPTRYFDYTSMTRTTDATLLQQSGYYSSSLYKEGYEVNFYYIANRHSLKFYNYNGWLGSGDGAGNTAEGEGVRYGTPMSVFGNVVNNAEYMKGHYPDGLEPDAYEFKGWYTSPGCLDGTKVDWDNMTMPDADLTLYAKWMPVRRNVYFHLTYDDMEENRYWDTTDRNGKPVEYPIVVEHGAVLGTAYHFLPERPEFDDTNGNGVRDNDEVLSYTFVGWFYIDETGKKRFAPDSMEVKKDLHLFAEWQSGIDTQYTVTYVLNEATDIDGTTYQAGEKIADDTTGHLTAGKTKTFTAKAGAELLSAFVNEKLYPTTNSHSILMAENSTENAFEFRYVADDAVWYRVRYVNKITGLDLAKEKVVLENEKTIVTEKFEPITGFIPESYYITKVLAADYGGSAADIERYNNEIIFYYTPDTEHALYTIVYYTENLDGSWHEEQSVLSSDDLYEADGVTPKIIKQTVDPKKFNGFTYAHHTVTTYSVTTYEPTVSEESTDTEIQGTLTAGGLEIRIYYKRNPYPYEIKFVEYGNPDNVLGYGDPNRPDKVLAATDLEEKFEGEVTYTAPDSFKVGDVLYQFYTAADTFPQTKEQSITIRSSSTDNQMVFYYKAKETTIYYKAVCKIPGAVDYGRVTFNYEKAASISGISGSEAIPGSGYKFVGWYKNKECTEPVDETWVKGSYLKPEKLSDDDKVYYYALFEPIVSQLTISKKLEGIDATSDSFLFHIKGKGKLEYVDLVVSVKGGESITVANLPVGDYTITELSGWSYQYTADQAERNAEVSESNVNEISFTNTYQGSDWLGDEDSVDNDFGTYTPGT